MKRFLSEADGQTRLGFGLAAAGGLLFLTGLSVWLMHNHGTPSTHRLVRWYDGTYNTKIGRVARRPVGSDFVATTMILGIILMCAGGSIAIPEASEP